MASPTSNRDVEASPQFDQSSQHEEYTRNSLGQRSGIGPALSSPASSQHGTDAGELDADAEWGPQHPCYPHLNPYVPLTSPLHQSTRIIRIRRDWMIAGDLAPTFSGLYPEILQDAGLGEAEFRRVVENVNVKLQAIYKPWAWGNVIDALLGLLTGWLWDDLGWTFAKRKLREVEGDLEKWNREQEKKGALERRSSRTGSRGLGSRGGGIQSRAGLSANGEAEESTPAKFIGLRQSGYLSLDIQIPTPMIGVVEAEAGEAEAERDGRDGALSRETARSGEN